MDGSRRRKSAAFCLERFTSLGECAIRICQLPIDGFLAMRRHYQEEAAHGCQQLDSRPLFGGTKLSSFGGRTAP